jgi:hypothetical protein
MADNAARARALLAQSEADAVKAAQVRVPGKRSRFLACVKLGKL